MRNAFSARKLGANVSRCVKGASQMKYQYDVVVHELCLLTPATPQGTIAVLWTR